MKKRLITSESVTEGHPDKICDQISDAILDDLIRQDPYSRVAIETLVTTGSVHVAGEVTTNGFCDVQKIARETLREIGYTDPDFGMDWEDAGIWVSLHGQSPDIALGVNGKEDKEQGAGDQGMMFGYACNETPELMPMPIMLAHKLSKRLADVRKTGIIQNLGPDGKSQVTVEYNGLGKPNRLEAIVIAQQHKENISEEQLKKDIYDFVITPICGKLMDADTKIHINATGKFVIGGPEGDTGLTGRKTIVDAYGGGIPVGGGAFSGKDPSKVDRSGAYAARYIAKNIVAAGIADEILIQIAYAIGVAKPVGVNVDCSGTNRIPEEEIENLIRDLFPLKPAEIIKELDLRRPIYKKTAAYGHFGREKEGFTWERTGILEPKLRTYLDIPNEIEKDKGYRR
ncbi:MAG: methionine adenosyltransferase [Candidatus Pacearchaeota archaeon]|nr:methionine adenosyltransferase [Candidatus Pacearchaeota archaeon]